jgi:Tfp pilus assembly protein PilO
LKFSKSSWILLTLGIAVIGVILAGMVWTQQAQQKQDLEKKLSEAQTKLAQVKFDELTARQTQLLEDKKTYTKEITAAKDQLTAPIDNISALDTILKSAGEFNITIVSINSNSKSMETFTGNSFSALPFSLQVKGNINDLADFVSNIKTLFPTSVVQTYQFAISTPTPTAATTPAPSPTSPVPTPVIVLPIDTEATINIMIYDYKGDANVE